MSVRVLIPGTVFRRAKILEKPLTDAGFDVVIATGEADALALCRGGRVDIVLLEGHQPGLDGFGFCRRLKAEDCLRHLPVGLITEEREPRQRFQALSAGADESFAFPMEEHSFIRRMRSLADLWILEGGLSRVLANGGFDEPVVETGRIPILVLDPDRRSRQRLEEILSPDFSVTCVELADQAISHMARERFGVVLCDFAGMAEAGPMAALLLHQLHLANLSHGIRVIGLGNETNEMSSGDISDILPRPVDRSEALVRVGIAVRKHGLSRALKQLEARLEPSRGLSAGTAHPLSPGRLAA